MLLFADSFEHYGTDTANMLAGLWSGFVTGGGASVSLSATHARTGSKALKLVSANGGGGGNTCEARFPIGAQSDTCGLGVGLFLTSLPSGAQKTGLQFRDTGNTPLLTLCIQSDGSICARKGSHTGAVIDISDSILTAGTFSHVEVKATFDTVAGYVEARVNGLTKLQIGSLNLGAVEAASCALMHFDINTSDIWFDDIIAWDDTGTVNNDFMGPQRVLTIFPATDTAQADMTIVGAASGHAAISEVPPNGDTSYLYSVDAGDKSDFGLPTLPAELISIAGLFVPVMARLDAAGVGDLKVSMISGGDVDSADEVPLTTGYTYYRNVFELDPDTSAPYTKTALEAALLRIEKSV